MKRTVSIAQGRDAFASLVHEAQDGGLVEVTRRGKTVAVMISAEEWERVRPKKKKTFMEVVDAWRAQHPDGAGLTDEELDELFARDQTPAREFSFE